MDRSLLLFRESIKTKITFQVYERRLQEFMRFCNVGSFDELTQVTNLQESLEDYIIAKKQNISPILFQTISVIEIPKIIE